MKIFTPSALLTKYFFYIFFSIPVCPGMMLSVGMQSGMLLLPGGWVIEVPQDKWLVQSDTPTQDSILAVQLHA